MASSDDEKELKYKMNNNNFGIFENVKEISDDTIEIIGTVFEDTWEEDKDFFDPIIDKMHRYRGKKVKLTIKIEEYEFSKY